MHFLALWPVFLSLGFWAGCSSVSSPKGDAAPRLVDIANATPASLEDCEKRCDSEDAAMAKVLGRMIRARQQAETEKKPLSGSDMEKLGKEFVEAGEHWFDKRKDSPDPARAFAAYQIVSAVQETAKSVDPVVALRLARKIKAGIPELVARYPQQPRAHFYRAQQLARENAAPEGVIREFKVCLELDPMDKGCRAGYEGAVFDYQEPYCTGAKVDPSLAFYLSSDVRSSQYPVSMNSLREAVFVERKPRLSKRDIARIKLDRPLEPILNGGSISLELTTSGAAKLAQLTEKNVGKFLAVTVKKRVILNPRINTPIREGRVMISMGAASVEAEESAKKLFAELCEVPTKRELPAELKLSAEAAR